MVKCPHATWPAVGSTGPQQNLLTPATAILVSQLPTTAGEANAETLKGGFAFAESVSKAIAASKTQHARHCLAPCIALELPAAPMRAWQASCPGNCCLDWQMSSVSWESSAALGSPHPAEDSFAFSKAASDAFASGHGIAVAKVGACCIREGILVARGAA